MVDLEALAKEKNIYITHGLLVTFHLTTLCGDKLAVTSTVGLLAQPTLFLRHIITEDKQKD